MSDQSLGTVVGVQMTLFAVSATQAQQRSYRCNFVEYARTSTKQLNPWPYIARYHPTNSLIL